MLTLGVIADDFTGATDVANNLVRAGMRVVQTIGLPRAPIEGADAVVVALKSRTASVDRAVSESVAAAQWLQTQGARQLYFKVCSTFDSTARGNIGPVAEALMELVDATWVPVTPAFPENGRTVFMGHLFVGPQLLSDSPMRNHPLTPMTDSSVVRLMQAQCMRERVGLLDHACVSRGQEALSERALSLSKEGVKLCVVDAVETASLKHLAQACVGSAQLPLVVAASGLASYLPHEFGFSPQAGASALAAAKGAMAIVSGSCSAATRAQVAHFIANGGDCFTVDALQIATGVDVAAQALTWAGARLGSKPLMVCASADPDAVKQVQSVLGTERAGELVEGVLSCIAKGLVSLGVGQLVIAGGETSGACVQALGIRELRIGPQIAPGVPWCYAAQPGLHLALKSGNFGGVDFFTSAFSVLKD
jgi:3-dehydrotetronate 4-kinase